MKRGIAVSDRIAGASLWLVAAVNVLFVLSFLAAVMAASGTARAEMRACQGSSIVAELEADDPARLAELRREAAATPNGRGLLWKIEKDGAEPSFLFGTMHMTDPRVVRLPAAAEEAFEASDTVVIETTDILDRAKMGAAMMTRPELMMFTGERSLLDFLSEQDRQTVAEGLAERGVPLASVQKMKPWMLMALVALPACEMARRSAGMPVLDAELAARAEKEGKELLGLETAAEQLDAMASLPMELHIRALVDTLALGERIDDIIETMIVLYVEGETAMVWPLLDAVLPMEEADESGYAAFEEAVVNARNRTMAERAKPILAEGDAFIAVGALHLPGEVGLIALLRDAGYGVEAVR